MLQTIYLFGQIFSSSTIWCKENGRIQKFIADNFSLKVSIFKLKLFINFRILPFSLHHRKDLSKNIWFVALIVNRFRDNRIKKRILHILNAVSSNSVARALMRAFLNYVFTGINRSLCQSQ